MALGVQNLIGDVTQMLHDLLTGLSVSLDSPAALQAPGGGGPFARVNLYLYQVLENPHAKNRPWVSQGPQRQSYPPLALNLYYLLTPYASDALSAHRVLSHAMRILHDNSIVRGPTLQESLRLCVEQLAIALIPLKLEELTRIWNALQTPYRLSVCYEVRVVLIESSLTRDPRRVTSRVDAYSEV